VDKVTVKHIETRIGVERFLTLTRATLLDGSYRPHPVRRVMIPKRGPGLVQDRVVQAALLQLREPIFEAEFLTVSYGFRSGGSTDRPDLSEVAGRYPRPED
jgi:RNA-directed DNA polymerase